MIPQRFIEDWRFRHAPRPSLTMVEQDLIISRSLVELYNQNKIKETLVFRGGTALNKIYLNPPSRYSEDIDFVQIKSEPIGEVIEAIRLALDSWLGIPKRKITERGVKLVYRYQSIENISARLKIEINTTEHYNILPLEKINYRIDSDWFKGNTEILTYHLNELMGSKLRALYQRRKGRDLFDLWLVLQEKIVKPQSILDSFLAHCEKGGHKISRAMFEKNLFEKSTYEDFRQDMLGLLVNIDMWSFDSAFEVVNNDLIGLLPGESWNKIK